jgi:uncharacterized membrane-anchored protein YitT (DUF2179 family)
MTMTGSNLRQLTYSIPYNLLLITAGSVIFGIGVKAIAMPHGLITGGISGVALLLHYWIGWLEPGQWYFLLNMPIFILGWWFVSRRFFFYSLYGMVIMTLAMDWMAFTIPVTEPVLAVLAGGTLIGTGSGIILNSLGSGGGNDIIAIILNQRFNFRIGTFFFLFNITLFALSLGRLPLDLVLFSLAMSFVTSQMVDYFLSIFNQRKMVLIISEQADAIAAEILSRIHRGATYLEGRGAFSGRKKDVLLTVVNNYQLKRVEELVFNLDPEAFVIMENTFNVLGKGFSHRKVY